MAAAKTTNEDLAIGIDLGTTFSCVAVVRNGKVEIIANEQGNYTTPSFAAFNEHERLIGDAAKQQLASNSENTIFNAKRLIGRKFDDPIVQKGMQQWPFSVIEENGMPKIEITYKNEVKRFSPEEISAMVLGKMKEIAESYLNAKVTNAVVTVPAYFNDMQRKATKDAAKIAGLNVMRIINEPTAAAIAYGFTNDTKVAKKFFVYDFGGGTFDVSILRIQRNTFEVRATGGDSHLGGEDFNNQMMKTFIDEFKCKSNIDISGNKKALRRLRSECERVKRELSSATRATIEIESLAEGIDFMSHISRIRFESMCAELFQSTIATVEGALKDAELKREDIDTIVLVGGSTRIPKVQQLLQEFFDGKEISKTINPDEAVARGAAIQAAIIHGNASKDMENMILMEVTPLTLGVASQIGGSATLFMSAVIKRNTRIPVCRSKVYRTVDDNQTAMRFAIIQGEHRLAADNFEIGEFEINGIPKAPAVVEKVVVTFSIDENGILTVSAVSENNADAKGEIIIKNVCGSLTEAEIVRMVGDAEKFQEQDKEVKKYYTARGELEQYCNDLKKTHGSARSEFLEKCDEVLLWLSICVRPNMPQFLQRKGELEALISPPKPKTKKRKLESVEEAGVVDDTDDVIFVADGVKKEPKIDLTSSN